MALLEVRDLSVTFRSSQGDTEAVKHVSFELNKGEVLALVGESGSGKTVTALSVLQLLPYPTADHPNGSITYDGREIIGARDTVLRDIRGNNISMIFQEPMSALNPLHTIRRQISEAVLLHQKMPSDKVLERVKELLNLVGLPHFHDRLDAYPHQLSGGERQRVMIAMAIANEPDILIADEPTTALDVSVQAQILSLLKELQKRIGMAVLLITHDLTIVRKVADRVAVMQNGELVEQGDVENVFTSPQHAYTKQLLASEPKGTATPLTGNRPLLVEGKNITVKFPVARGVFGNVRSHVTAVDDVSVTLQEAATLGIVGESGSGKTTLGLALLRLIKSEGTIIFMGKPISGIASNNLRELRSDMQIVFQDPYGSLNPRLTVEEIILEGLTVHSPQLSSTEKSERLDAILKEVGLKPEMKDRYPHAFSGGQRQRISIARALILKPKLIVLDEPTSALDLSIQAQLIALLKDLQSKHGIAYMFISHDLRVVRALSHHVVVLRKGRIVDQGSTEELFRNPKDDYTRLLIDAAFPDKVA